MPKMIGATGFKIPPKGVFRPGEKGYHGHFSGKGNNDEEWGRAARAQNQGAASDHRWKQLDNNSAKLMLGISGATAGTGLATGALINHQGKKQARKIRQRGGVAKGAFKPLYSELDPLMRLGHKTRRGYDVSTMPKKPEFRERVYDFTNRHGREVATAGSAVGMGGVLLGASRADEHMRRARADARRAKRRKTVAKRGPKPSMLRQHFGTPRLAAATIRRNPEYVAAGGAAAVAGGAQARPLERRRNERQRDRADIASAGIAGGVGGQAAFRGAGYTVRAVGHRKERERPEGMSRSQHQKIMSNHYKSLGLRQNEKTADPKFYRTYPKGLPATPYKRVLGQTSGKRGAAMLAATTAAGALAAGGSVRGRKKNIAKALYQRDERLSLTRTAQLGAGLGLLAWGTGRSRMVGTALARGIKAAQGKDNAQVINALQLAQAAQGALARGTRPAERSLRQIQRVDAAVRAVPGAIRPEVAVAAGALLAGHSMPVRRTTYRPVSSPVHRGW